MGNLVDTLSIAASGMKAQAERLRFVSENIANEDTPGFRRKLTTFEEVVTAGERTGTVQTGPVELDRSALARIHDPGNPLADQTGYYDGSNVDLVVEIADAREAQRSYEANLRVFDQARQMSQNILDLLKR